MIKKYKTIIILLMITHIVFAQQPDSVKTKQDSTKIKKSQSQSLVIKKKTTLKQPTMPQLPTLSEKNHTIHFDIRSQYLKKHPEEATNWDAMNRPGSYKYEMPNREMVIKPTMPLTPLEVPDKPFYNPLPLRDYVIPTRNELDILEILWAKENVMDTTIYSCLDTLMNVTFMDLNRLMAGMSKKSLVSRRIVSPRNEFNLFGVLIEMSPTNRRNRIYEYRSNVDRDLMRTFVDANAYLFSEDSSIVNLKQLRAARKDSGLLRDLNVKLNQPRD
ncbi:hypothetical protein H8E88_26570 [candidate division KSB1 bacterium]|nr:hypothetical protein [candidate division KSB1 bacterium]MBL7094940.1 hypothetical protein [candidate division KSB1 bacterium]